MKFITANDFIIALQDAVRQIGNWRIECFGATSNGKYSVHLSDDNGNKKTIYIDQFDYYE